MSITGADECYIADILGSRNPYIIPKHQKPRPHTLITLSSRS